MVQRRKILVIDDDQSVCDVFARTLGDRGYEVYTETRYPEGVKKAEEVLPDLVFVSLLLDTTNGLKVSKEIHAIENLKKVPIVMLISYKGELDPKYTVTIGVVDVLVKPPRGNDIILKTEAILGSYAGTHGEYQGFSGISDEEEFGAVADRSEDRKKAEEFVPGSTVKTDKEGLEFDDRYHEIPEIRAGDVNQNREYISRSGDALSDRKEIKMPDESGFGEAAGEADEPVDFGETDLKSLSEEVRDTDDNLEMQGEDEFNYFGKNERNRKSRKILMLAAGLVLIVVIGIGTYLGLQFLFGRKDRPVIHSSPSDAPAVLKRKGESLPGAQTKKGQAEVPEHSPAAKVPKGVAEQNKETFSVQVGFFGSLKNAEVLADKMKQKGFRAFIKKEERAAGKKAYRVLVGKFSSRNEAVEQSKVIRKKEGIKPVLYKESGTPS